MLCSEFVDSQPAHVYAHGTGRRGLSSSEPQGESFYNSLTSGVSDDAGGHEKEAAEIHTGGRKSNASASVFQPSIMADEPVTSTS